LNRIIQALIIVAALLLVCGWALAEDAAPPQPATPAVGTPTPAEGAPAPVTPPPAATPVTPPEATPPATPPATTTPDAAVPPAAIAPASIVPVAPAPPPPAPKFEPPTITTDTSIFRRSPVIDGVIEDGEWDAFYSFGATGWDATAFADWDSGNLYLGVKSNKPFDVMAVIDGYNDGWFHGEDNYELRSTGGVAGNMALVVSRYDSKNTKSPVAIPVTQDEAAMIEVKSSKSDAGYMVEMRVPAALVKGLNLSRDRKLGLQINVNAGDDFSGWIPTKELGDTRECTLVTRKFAFVKPLEVGLDLRSDRVARGEELAGRLHLTNNSTDPLDVRTFVLGGEGKASDYLSSQKVRLEGLPAKKHYTHDMTSVIPSDMRLGCWAVGAEVRSGTQRLGSALISFEVVEPFSMDLRLPSRQVKANVKDVTVAVIIRNNTLGRMHGTVKVTFPNGWELWRNANKRDFTIPEPDGATSVSFKAKPPLGALGDTPIKVEVTANGRTLSAEGKIVLVNP